MHASFARATGGARARRRSRVIAVAVAAVVVASAAGCADFSAEAAPFTVQPSLTAPAPQPETPTPLGGATPSIPTAAPSTPPGASGELPADPCAPTDAAVIATCLAAPWGLAPLPDGLSALVGERTTGRLLRVAQGQPPAEVATITDLDATGTGGLLGIALSPSYPEDGLVYAFVTTATDNRIVRIAPGEPPEPIFTGIPKGPVHNGGRIAFAGDGTLHVGTGDTGDPRAAADPASLAGTVLRLDEFGKPAENNPEAGSPILARGFTDVAGMCTMANGAVAALDRRENEDVLIAVTGGEDYRTLASGDALWTWTTADGGAADCAVDAGVLASTSLDAQELTGVPMTAAGGFTGSPGVLLDNRYGRLLTVEASGLGLLWMTTSNRDGEGTPVPSDDRVVVLPSGGGGEGGPD